VGSLGFDILAPCSRGASAGVAERDWRAAKEDNLTLRIYETILDGSQSKHPKTARETNYGT
jgi:hypothetical protein